MKKKKGLLITRDIFLYLIPSLVFISFHVLCICGIRAQAESLSMWSGTVQGLFHDCGVFWGCVISIPLGVILVPLTMLMSLLTPVLAIAGEPFAFGDWAIFALSVSTVLTIIGAFFFRLGEFQEDSSYVSGSHYEITFDSSGKGLPKKVNDYSGGGEWALNILLFIARMLLIEIGGIVIFIVRAVRYCRYI